MGVAYCHSMVDVVNVVHGTACTVMPYLYHRNKDTVLNSVLVYFKQDFLTKYSESKYELADSTLNFGRHKILECAREILEKSQKAVVTKDSIIQMSDDLENVLCDVSDVCVRGGGGMCMLLLSPVQLASLCWNFTAITFFFTFVYMFNN